MSRGFDKIIALCFYSLQRVFQIQMIRKCNTSQSKVAYTPYSDIRVSDFVENQEEICDKNPSECDSTDNQLRMNIRRIKECKEQTEACINDMQCTIQKQRLHISALERVIEEEKEKNRVWRKKYHQSLLCLRRKQEQSERSERGYADCKEKLEFMMAQSQSDIQGWFLREQRYKRRIEQLQEINRNNVKDVMDSLSLQEIQRYSREIGGLSKEQDTTFI